jgi:hypothetical protein
VFYPKDIQQSRELQFASRVLNTMEISGSHYSLQMLKSYESWHSATPIHFIFGVKGPRYLFCCLDNDQKVWVPFDAQRLMARLSGTQCIFICAHRAITTPAVARFAAKFCSGQTVQRGSLKILPTSQEKSGGGVVLIARHISATGPSSRRFANSIASSRETVPSNARPLPFSIVKSNSQRVAKILFDFTIAIIFASIRTSDQSYKIRSAGSADYQTSCRKTVDCGQRKISIVRFGLGAAAATG